MQFLTITDILGQKKAITLEELLNVTSRYFIFIARFEQSNKPVSYNKNKLFPFSYDKINAAIFNTVWQYLWQKLFLKHYENKMVFHLVYLITLKILFVLFCKNISNIYTCMYNKHEKNSFLYLYFHNRVWSVIFFSPQCSRLKIDEATLLLLPLFWNNIHQQSKVWKFNCYDVCIFRNNNISVQGDFTDLQWFGMAPCFPFCWGTCTARPIFSVPPSTEWHEWYSHGPNSLQEQERDESLLLDWIL